MKNMKLGFTLIEVTIFLAVSALLFFGVTIGVQSTVYQQRSNDSVQNFMEFLRGVYSQATNVQNTRGQNGGQADEAIYGRVAVFSEGKDIVVYSVVGNADAESMDGVEPIVSGDILVDNYTPRWGALIYDTEGNDLMSGSMLVMRSPSTGVVTTYWSSNKVSPSDGEKEIKFGVDGFKAEQIDFCMKADSDAKAKDIRVAKMSRNASGITLYSDEGNACK